MDLGSRRFPPVLEQVQGEQVAPVLRHLLWDVYTEVQREEPDVPRLWDALDSMLRYLASHVGRTNANCWAVDCFFMHNDRWERGWEHLPEEYQDLLGHLGGALHDSVFHPDIAENFESTPEQLLARLYRLST
jgi:hypothetical protein